MLWLSRLPFDQPCLITSKTAAIHVKWQHNTCYFLGCKILQGPLPGGWDQKVFVFMCSLEYARKSYTFNLALTCSSVWPCCIGSLLREGCSCFITNVHALAIKGYRVASQDEVCMVTEMSISLIINQGSSGLKPFKPYIVYMILVTFGYITSPCPTLSASAERVGQGEVGGITRRVTCTWWLVGLAV